MDLKQVKLNKSEWDSIEISVSENELEVLNMINAGYENVNIKVNNNNSLFNFLKIEYSVKKEDYIYNKYFRNIVEKLINELNEIDIIIENLNIKSNLLLNSADRIRLERFDINTIPKNEIYEFVLLNIAEYLISYKKRNNIKLFHYYYYTLYKLIQNNIINLNKNIINFINKLLEKFADNIDKSIIIQNAVEFIEKNPNLLKYGDLTLYLHQKEIFTICKLPNPKLILYSAPTGTGKTLTPIALSQEKKIIFICAARHVGLALAKSALSLRKKIAFAFGCSSADDIRLHYFAAKEYTKNKYTGGIGKVDNSVGNNVEIMICDIKSYLPAMYYMLAFFQSDDIILYWDEPTITLDYKEHEFHSIIKKNWTENLIPNIVLSSATLPKENELTETIPDFMNKFNNGRIYNIVSHDCKKSIPIINKDGNIVLPHYLTENYEDIIKMNKHLNECLTLLRYFDLNEVVQFITYINENNLSNSKMNLNRHFETLDDINMKNIKVYYLKMLDNIKQEHWGEIYQYFINIQKPIINENEDVDVNGTKIQKFNKLNSIGPGIINNSILIKDNIKSKNIIRQGSEQYIRHENNFIENKKGTSGIYITTKDAYTLTDGPTIFISDEVEKIAKFCIQQAQIPSIIIDNILEKIEYNNNINKKISILENEMERLIDGNCSNDNNNNKSSKNKKDNKKINRTNNNDSNQNKNVINKLKNEINTLRAMIKNASLNDTFVPNTKHHLEKWSPENIKQNSFTSSIDTHIISDIMAINGIDDLWKLLLMMGIGVFMKDTSDCDNDFITYTEIMKKLAYQQKLYLIIASSDYIYGTNYQFCHGFLGKDLNLTQEKIIQALGRIGRNNIQQTYTIRFRDNDAILKLFNYESNKPEVINMNLLFNSSNIIYENGIYREI
jgi:hypothetical protein